MQKREEETFRLEVNGGYQAEFASDRIPNEDVVRRSQNGYT